MKNVFGSPCRDDKALPCDGERFVTERVDEAFKREIEDSRQRVDEILGTKLLTPKLLIVMGVFTLGFVLAAMRMLKLMNQFGSAAFAKEPLTFAIGFVCVLLVFGAFASVFVKRNKINSSDELAAAKERVQSLGKSSEALLGIPQEHETVDVLSFEYDEASGKVKQQGGGTFKYFNNAMKLYRKDDMLCLADIEQVYSLPIADLKKYVLKKKKITMDCWNKEIYHNCGKYIPYKISKNDNNCYTCKYCAAQFSDAFGEYEMFFPEYELEAFKAIADAPVENE